MIQAEDTHSSSIEKCTKEIKMQERGYSGRDSNGVSGGVQSRGEDYM